MSIEPYEPYVILDRTALPASRTPRRWTVLRGRKPAILLIEGGGAAGSGLDLPLAQEGFDIYRTSSGSSAVELLDAHPSVLMALVRLDVPGLEPVALIRKLHETRPGLWIGMLAEPGDQTRASEGYAAGAVDLFHAPAPPHENVERLIRSVPWALRNHEQADRRALRRVRRGDESWLRKFGRGLRPRAALAATAALGLFLGVAVAGLTRGWLDSQEEWNAKYERMIGALEAARPVRDRIGPQLDRLQRREELDLQRRSFDSQRAWQREQLDEERMRDLLRSTSPRYLTP